VRWPFPGNRKFRMTQRSVIFDLDGTLIDSAPSILRSIEATFCEAGIEPLVPLSVEMIGPPLEKVLTSLLGPERIERLPQLIECFKTHYDEVGFLETKIFDGVQQMLEQLNYSALKLYVATNKRLVPTRLIIQHLGWDSFFEKLFTLDSYCRPANGKADMLKRLSLDLREPTESMVYVGDRLEDAEAARSSQLPFVLVSWGYEKIIPPAFPNKIVNSPDELLQQVIREGAAVSKNSVYD
jgi:phosphoglycolate phosphatase